MLTDIGAKYHKATDAVRVILRDGSLKPLSTPNSVSELSEEGQEMCQYVSEVRELLSFPSFHLHDCSYLTERLSLCMLVLTAGIQCVISVVF